MSGKSCIKGFSQGLLTNYMKCISPHFDVYLRILISFHFLGVTVVVLTRRRMRSSTNTYLTALAISDLLHLVFVFTLSLEHYPNSHSADYFFYWVYRPFGLWLADAASKCIFYLVCPKLGPNRPALPRAL